MICATIPEKSGCLSVTSTFGHSVGGKFKFLKKLLQLSQGGLGTSYLAFSCPKFIVDMCGAVKTFKTKR